MKKFVSLFIGILLTVTALAQGTNSYYHSAYYERENKINMKFTGEFTCMINVDGEYKSDDVALYFKGKKELEAFAEAMKAVKEKCEEWDKIAKDNNVTKMNKEVPVSLPRTTIAWYSSKWYFQFDTRITPTFMILESSGKALLVIGGKASASSNEYITQKYYLALYVDEIGDFIDALDIEKIEQKAEESKNIDNLFQ